MTLHDADLSRFGQWWRRSIRSGWAFAEGAHRYGGAAERYNMRQFRSLIIWGAAAPAVILALAAAAILGAVFGAGWVGFAAAAIGLGLCAAYPAMAMRIALDRRRRFGDSWRDALLYGGFTMIGKFAQALGALRFARMRRSGAQASLIEYKSAPGSASGS